MGTLVIVAHGVGQHAENFHEEWEAKLRIVHPQGDFEVEGLWWDDLQDRIQDKYPLLSSESADLLAKFDGGVMKDFRGSDSYTTLRETLLDVLVYCALSEMRTYLQTAAALRLMRATRNRYKSTVLIGHSLGCALLKDLTQLERIHLGSIGYKGMILLAPPFGIESPTPLLPDPLRVTPTVRGEHSAGSRADVLAEIAYNWAKGGPRRLHLVLNRNDIVCSEARYSLAGQNDVDVLPFLRTGLDDREEAALKLANLQYVQFGSNQITDIGDNHSVLNYFDQPAFQSIFKEVVG